MDIHIKKGAIYGFIGRNGADKTTCMRMIGGLAKTTSGEISMLGYAGKDLSKVRSRVGCLIEAPGVYPNMDISPLVGFARPPIILIQVVLPAPFLPINP